MILNDEVNKLILVSNDEGQSWDIIKVDFTPSLIDYHPTNRDIMFSMDNQAGKMWLSTDAGKSWKNVLPGKQVSGAYW